MNVVTDYARAEQVFGRLLEALAAEQYPYNVAKPPQRRENIPASIEWGSVEHAWFLLCVCYYMRGGITSETAILSLGQVYAKDTRLFDPSYFVGSGPGEQSFIDKVQEVLRTNRLGYNCGEVAAHWVRNFVKIHRYWKGDPANLLRGVNDYEEVCSRIIRKGKWSAENPNGFFGFQRKMASMLIHFFLDAGLVDQFLFPVPVDFHVLRVMTAHRLLVAIGDSGEELTNGEDLYKPAVLSAARELSMRYCAEHGVDPLRLGDALWLLSGALCQQSPSNRTRIGKRNGRKTDIAPVKVTWSDSQYSRWLRSCGSCPVSDSCCFAVPAGDYYVRGQLILRSGRDIPLTLFSFGSQTA